MNPLVSIVIPVYNGANYLGEAIESALSQTYQNIEIIVVNDGSNDGGKTREVALSYGDKIRYFEKENGGTSSALNLGIKNMKGNYFSWLSHDDLYHPEKVRIEIDAIDKYGDENTIVYCNFAQFFENYGEHVIYEDIKSPAVRKVNGTITLLETTIFFCALLIPKSYFDKYGLFNENLPTTQDIDKQVDIFVGNELLYVDCVMTYHRRHDKEVRVRLYDKFMEEMDRCVTPKIGSFANSCADYNDGDMWLSYSMLLTFKWTDEYVKQTLRLMLSMPEPIDADEKIDNFKRFLASFGGKYVYIACAGTFGIRLANNLMLRDINVMAVSDNNAKKHNAPPKGLEWIKCISHDDIPKDALVIIAKDTPQEMKDMFFNKGYRHITDFHEVIVQALRTPIKKEQALICLKRLLRRQEDIR